MEQVEANLEKWSYALKERTIKVSRSKTVHVYEQVRQDVEVMKLDGFKYFELTVQSNE